MSFKSFYEELHAARKVRNYDRPDDETDRDVRNARIRGEYRYNIQDLLIDEIQNLLYQEDIAKRFYGAIGQGKEANVYWIKDHDNRHLALKMFRIHTTNHNFRSLHIKSKLSDTAKLSIASTLCLREFNNLQSLNDSNVRIAKPIERYEFMYTMEFLGTKRGPSPLLGELDTIEINDPIDLLDDILEQYDLMFNKAKMVHGDFSEHNLVYHENKPFIIDVVQAEKYHPKFQTSHRIRKREALKIMKKDIITILDFFKKRFRKYYQIDDVFSVIAGDLDNLSPDAPMSENFDLDKFEEFVQEVKLDE